MVLLNISSDTFFFWKNLMRIFGSWPLDGRRPRSILTFSVFLLIETAIVMLYLGSLFTKCAGYIVGQYEVMTTALVIMGVVLRLIIRVSGSHMIPLIESTIDDWSLTTDPIERTIMKRHDKIGIFLFPNLIMFLITFPCVRDFFILAFTNTLTPKHRLSSTGNECLAWDVVIPFLNISARIILGSSYYSTVLLIWSLTTHHCAQYQILKQQFRKFLQIGDEKERRREFRRLADRHNELIGLSRKLDDSTNVFLAFEVITGLLMVCITAYQLGYAIKNSDFMELTEMIAYIVFLVVTGYSYCCVADYLTTSSEEIGDVLRQCNWYDLSKESIINFSIVIAQTRRPACLTVAKIYKLNHSACIWLLNASYSYISIIVPITKS